MQQNCLVLVLGPSTVLYSETDESRSITGMLQSALQRSAPEVEWECTARILFFSANMARRARRLVSEVQPDVVVYVTNSRQFDEDVVVGRILRRWPRLYPKAQRFAARLRGVAGGRAVGSPSARGWLYRVPRWLAFRLIGAEPILSLEEATSYAESVLDALVEIEDIGVAFCLAPTCEVSDRRSLQRVDGFQRTLAAYCETRRIPHAFRHQYVAEAGEVPRLSSDGRHADLRTRELDAAALSSLVLQLQRYPRVSRRRDRPAP